MNHLSAAGSEANRRALVRQPGLSLPDSVAIVGASQVQGGSYYGGRLLANMIAAMPKAALYPVNPRYAGQEIEGLKVYAELSELPEVPDFVVITTAVKTVLPVLREAARMGVPTCVVISAEKGDQTARRSFDAEVAAIARASGMRIIGPNSMGVMNGNAGLNCSFTSATTGVGLAPGNVAALTQSGAAIAYLLQVFRGTSLGYSWLISTGNEAGTSLEQLFEEVVDDPKTDVLLLFIEGIADGNRFRKAALRARAMGKAVLMLNSGVSEPGREAVQSHTGRIAGAGEIIAAVAEEAGIIRARSYQDFFDYAKALAEQAVPRRGRAHRRRAAIITTSGGAGTVAADQLSAQGWTLPHLPADVVGNLEVIAKAQGIGNPIDVSGAFADKTMLPRLIRTVAECDAIDAIFVVTGAGGSLAAGVAEEIVAATGGLAQEIYVAWVGLTRELSRIFDGTPVAVYPDPLRAVMAADASASFRCGQQQAAETAAALALLDAPPSGKLSHRVCAGLASAADTLAAIADAGVPCAPYAVCPTLSARGVVEIAERIGYPVVLKIDSIGLSHKSDSGGVRLRLADAVAVTAAVQDFERIARATQLASPRVLVQAMVSGIEVLVGVKHDDAFGPLLVLGLGGTHAELHADSATSVVLPATRAALEGLVARHGKLGLLLAGYRGQAPGDRGALLDTLAAIADWAVAQRGLLREADFNPVMVTPTGAFVVDARAVWAESSMRHNAR